MLSNGGRVYEVYVLSLVRYISSRNYFSSYAVSTLYLMSEIPLFHDVRTSAKFTFSLNDGFLATTFIFPPVCHVGALFLALVVVLVQ